MRLITAIALVVALFAMAHGAASTTPNHCVENVDTGEVICTVTETEPGSGSPGGGGPPVTVPSAGDVLWWPVLVWEPPGRTCVEFRREVFSGAATSQRAEEAESRAHELLAQWPLCSTSPTPPTVLPAIARDYIERVGLPVPDPHIAPGYALAGKAAYLETRSTLSPAEFAAPTPAGDITVRARGTYVVDWGDGSPSQSYTVEGRPWPDGQIRHVYTHTGTYTVTVSIVWVADWTAATSSGTATGITTTARIVDFQVRELQAVRNR